jgi:hypothetical protein
LCLGPRCVSTTPGGFCSASSVNGFSATDSKSCLGEPANLAPIGTAGTTHGELRKALKAGLYMQAMAAAHDLPVVPLDAALELTLLAAEKDPGRFEAMAVRWLSRLAQEKRPSLHEFVWASQRLQDVKEGRMFEAGPALRRQFG